MWNIFTQLFLTFWKFILTSETKNRLSASNQSSNGFYQAFYVLTSNVERLKTNKLNHFRFIYLFIICVENGTEMHEKVCCLCHKKHLDLENIKKRNSLHKVQYLYRFSSIELIYILSKKIFQDAIRVSDKSLDRHYKVRICYTFLWLQLSK